MKELPIEDKKLLLKDLSARLPYSVKVLTPNDQEVYTLLALHPNKNIAVIGFEMDGMYVTSKVKIEDCKPLLRPMSDMTEEEKVECKHLVAFSGSSNGAANFVDWLHAHYFDYHYLVKKDLAIAVTEENNPYKNEQNA